MNRIAQLSVALSVLFCAVSCVEKLNTEIPDTADYITVTSEVDPHTKAGYEGTSVLPSSFTMTIKQGTGSANPYTMNRAGTSSNHYNFSDNAPTWTTPDVSHVSIKAITASEEDVADGILDFSVQTDQSSDSAVQSSDLLGAKTGAGITISGNNINVAFNHLMSKLQVSYSSSLEVEHIELANVAVKGTYSYTDMKHSYSGSQSGTITKMYSTGNSAEAIFFPFAPEELDVEPELRIYLKGQSLPLTKKIVLRNGSRFNPGKLYMMKISVNGTADEDVTVENWGANASVQVPGERVLWVGTSIPAGAPEAGFVSYPEYVDEAMNCTIVNNAVGGSLVVMKKDATWTSSYGGWVLPEQDPTLNWQLIMTAGALSQTIKEADDIYRPHFVSLLNGDTTNPLIDQELNKIKALSYENLIIPYINGEKDNCTTVIIDHGFNDRAAMIFEAIGLASGSEHVYGYNYLMSLRNKSIRYADYLGLLEQWPNLTLVGNYIVEMTKIIEAIHNENPDVRIIIGNYFTLNNPVVTAEYAIYAETYPCYMYFANLISYFNEAVAGIWDLDIVNVQNYLWLDDAAYYEYCNTGEATPVHPWTPVAVQAIADVYINALDGVIGSRVN